MQHESVAADTLNGHPPGIVKFPVTPDAGARLRVEGEEQCALRLRIAHLSDDLSVHRRVQTPER